jgi:hypothetical protein
MTNFSYWQKQSDTPLFPDTEWSKPEQKLGHLAIIGGNSQNFSAVNQAVGTASKLPLKSIKAYLPDSLKSKIPANPITYLTASNNSGGFSREASAPIKKAMSEADYILFIGDLGRSSDTAITITDIIKSDDKPYIITRDTVDLIMPEFKNIVTAPHCTIFASMPQLQKVFRTIYYPKIILLSMPLVQLVETLHKFTITYPCTIATLHNESLIVANGGQITTTKLKDTAYSPLSVWNGALPAVIATYNIWSPANPLESTTTAFLAK